MGASSAGDLGSIAVHADGGITADGGTGQGPAEELERPSRSHSPELLTATEHWIPNTDYAQNGQGRQAMIAGLVSLARKCYT